MPLAIRMSKMRTQLETHIREMDVVRLGIISRLTDGGTDIKSDHEKWGEWVELSTDLMDTEFTVDGQITLYVRPLEEENAEGDTEEYSFLRNFKSTVKPREGLANTIHDLRGLLVIEEVE